MLSTGLMGEQFVIKEVEGMESIPKLPQSLLFSLVFYLSLSGSPRCNRH